MPQGCVGSISCKAECREQAPIARRDSSGDDAKLVQVCVGVLMMRLPLSLRHPIRESPTEDRPRLHRAFAARSEEHTSELQSLMRISYAVFCLNTKTNIHSMTSTVYK